MPPACYEIIVEGLLDSHWCEWFEGLTLEHMSGDCTRITGELPDQSALRAVVEHIFDLNLPLLIIRRIA